MLLPLLHLLVITGTDDGEEDRQRLYGEAIANVEGYKEQIHVKGDFPDRRKEKQKQIRLNIDKYEEWPLNVVAAKLMKQLQKKHSHSQVHVYDEVRGTNSWDLEIW
ncbi:hypothetical protein PIB30_076883 [Stylosanthes scabra]|uniref:Uncharacterized protein n=1 Tax=Stylosanthes scabra TaxID=79078 RepID=A0ABU6RQ81_9FABA|nr:hypothetical protein [Stylosanthes scabra]